MGRSACYNNDHLGCDKPEGRKWITNIDGWNDMLSRYAKNSES